MIKHRIEVFEGRNGFYWRARHLKTAKRIGLVLMVAPVVNVEKKYG
jgi:hypothetical protein